MVLMSLKAIITTFPIKRGLQVNNFQKVKFLTDFSTQQYCHVEFPFKFFYKGQLISKCHFGVFKFLQKNEQSPFEIK